MVYAAHVMICQRVLNVRVLCMYLVGLMWVLYYCTMYYMCVLLLYVGDSIYRVTEQTKTYIIPCLDCLCSFYINPVQRTEVNVKK